jgi:hypothetical protein
MHRGPTNPKRRRQVILKRVTDTIFYIVLALFVVAVIALLIWNETELVEECMREGHSKMYCIRILN